VKLLNKEMMIKTIPLFPLKLVAFPGEQLNLHIFEDRYKQLVADIKDEDGVFGISVYLDRIMEVGTEVKLNEVVKTYEDGRLDISTQATRTFSLIDFVNPLQGNLYAGGTVEYLENDTVAPVNLYEDFKALLNELFKLMNYDIDLLATPLNSFTYAHKIGMSIEQEYELLKLKSEGERIIFIIKHLIKIIPILKEVEEAKRKIKLNGHFKLLDPLDF
jgi:hypothetical protein